MKFIIDSGASCSLISNELVPGNIKINRDKIITINGINGKSKSLGLIKLKLRYGSYTFYADLHVAKNLPKNVPALLGTDFLENYGAKINLQTMELELVHGNTNIFIPFDGSTNNQILTIPARSEILTFIRTKIKNECLILNKQVSPFVFIANSIATPRQGKIPVRIINVANKEVCVDPKNIETKDLKDYNVIGKIELPKYDANRANQLLKELNLKHLTKQDQVAIQKLCLKYADVFCLKNDKLTVTNKYTSNIKIRNGTTPIFSKQYRLPQAQKKEINDQIDKMMSDGIIEKTSSEWNSPILLVPKKSANDKKKWRLVIDYRKLNNVLENDTFPLPNIEEVIDSLAGAKYFSHLDLSQGYYQCNLKPEDRPLTAFTTSTGQYQMTRLPMGLKISPASFSRLMTLAMTGLNGEKCLVYLDDLIIFGKTLEEHNKNLSVIFQRLREVNLKLNPEKCNFLQEKLVYLGHYISAEGVQPDPQKTAVIKSWPRPTNADEVKRFVAFANYYRKHIQNFAALCAPLNFLTRKNIKFEWNKECETSFQQLKQKFLSAPILDFPDFSEENIFTLHTDASGYAIGAVLSNKNGKPVAYASKMLNSAEKNYPTIEKELLAMVWGIRHFRPYLYGRKFVVYTDHRPLVYLFSLTDPSSRLTKFRLALEEYNFEVIYKKGSENVVADALSRITISDLKEIKKKIDNNIFVTTRSKTSKLNQDNDPIEQLPGQQFDIGDSIEVKFDENSDVEMKFNDQTKQVLIKPAKTFIQLRRIIVMLKKLCKDKNIKEILIENTINGKTFKDQVYTNNFTKGMPAIILMDPKIKHITNKNEQDLIINDFHMLPTAGHMGIKKTIKNIKRRYFWSSITRDVTRFIKSCEICQKNKTIKPKKTPMTITTTATSAFNKIYLDLVGPLVPSYEGHSYILTTQCELSKFITATPIKDKSTEVVAKAFVENVLLNYGIPEEIATDRGTEFMSDLFKRICELLKIKKLNSTAYHHQTIGALENSHKTLGNFLRIYASGTPGNWASWIKYYQFAYNTTTHLETDKTPFELVFGKLCRLPSNLTPSNESIEPLYNSEDYEKLLKYKLQKTQQEVRDKLINSKTKRAEKYNETAKKMTYKIGQLVLIKNETGSKLETVYKGPYSIVEDKDTNVIIRIGDKTDTIHKSRVKPFITKIN